MVKNIYTIKDKVAGECGPNFEAVNDSVAVRATVQLLTLAPQKEDYELLCIGAINTETGSLCPCEIRKINFLISSDKSFAVIEGGKE